MNDHAQQPSGLSVWVSAIGIIALFLAVGVVLYRNYVPTRQADATLTPSFSKTEMDELNKLPPGERDAKLAELRWQRRVPTPEERKAKLDELRAAEERSLATYTWIDQGKGIVRLPITQAMDLTLQDLQRKHRAR